MFFFYQNFIQYSYSSLTASKQTMYYGDNKLLRHFELFTEYKPNLKHW